MTSVNISTIRSKHINSMNHFQRRKVANLLLILSTGGLTLTALAILFWIVGYVLLKGGQYINLDFFIRLPTPMGVSGGGVLHAIEGTFLLSLMAAFFSIPTGVIIAFYTAYHPNTPLGVAVRFSTDVLSGIPSIVIGIFCYALVVKPIGHYSALAGGIALSIIMLPIIIRTTEEMLKLVPPDLREGSLALGAPEWKTSLKVTLPAAITGVVTGCILAVARASGETAPLLFTALGNDRFDLERIISTGIQTGQSIFAILGRIFEQPVDSLPLTLFKYTQQPYPERINQAWAVALVLMILVLFSNLIVRFIVYWRTSRSSHH
jgi:phosphate transport system permease protein